MNESQENFEALRQLLALKRHEVPPHGYFNDFSGQVIARIRAGGASPEAASRERLFDQVPWLLRILQIIEGKPVFVGSFATALCVLLLGGVVYSEYSEGSAGEPMTHMAQMINMAAPLAAASPMLPTATPAGAGLTTNFNPNLQPVASLFGEQSALAQPVSISIPGN